MSKLNFDSKLIGGFFLSLVLAQVLFGTSFEVGFVTKFRVLDIAIDTKDFWISIFIQCFCIFLLILKIEMKIRKKG